MKISDGVQMLTALAQESRLRIFQRLVCLGPDQEMAAGALAEDLSVSTATLSFHLKELTHAGLLCARRQGRHIFYSISVGGISSLIGFLTQDCCQGRPDLCGFETP